MKMDFVGQTQERLFTSQMRPFLKRLSRLLLVLFFVLSFCGIASYVILRRNPISWGMRYVLTEGLPDGYTWQYHEGIDFDIYQAQHPDGKDAGIGVYLGDWPDFPYADNLSREDGNEQVFGNKVSWVVLDGSEETTHEFYRTTLLKHQYSVYYPVYVHIWIYAEEEDDLQTILNSLESLRIKPMSNLFQLLVWRLTQR